MCIRDSLYADAANAKTKMENGFDLTNYDERTSVSYTHLLLSIENCAVRVDITIKKLCLDSLFLFNEEWQDIRCV